MGARVRAGIPALWAALVVLAAADLARAGEDPHRPATQVVRVATPARFASPVAAHDLARHLGLGYADEGDHVLLGDRFTRVRIWKDSNRVSIDGHERSMRGRAQRHGMALVLPGPMADYVRDQVYLDRQRHVAPPPPPPRPVAVRPIPPREPQKPVARPAAPAPTPRADLDCDACWIPPAYAGTRAWRWIVLHHSDDLQGNLAKYDRIHRETNRWDECGYHFVIGNGTLSGDGQIEVGTRWSKQKHGAHAKTDDNRFNDFGIGICLVGDFERHGRPSAAQMDSLIRLCRWLMERYQIPAHAVLGHADCKPTACPGRYFPWAELRAALGQ